MSSGDGWDRQECPCRRGVHHVYHVIPLVQFVVPFYFLVFVLYSHKSQVWGGSQHNNEEYCYLYFNWLWRRSSLNGSQNHSFTWSCLHTHVLSLRYFGNSTKKFHSSLLDVLQMFSCSFQGGKLLRNSQSHQNISWVNHSNKSYYSSSAKLL